jgi:hypothetical protein
VRLFEDDDLIRLISYQAFINNIKNSARSTNDHSLKNIIIETNITSHSWCKNRKFEKPHEGNLRHIRLVTNMLQNRNFKIATFDSAILFDQNFKFLSRTGGQSTPSGLAPGGQF